ncbi:pyruvate dehydrogenase complex dihydrolipoamide acetyltransferase [Actinomadura nitritigenes]|uniref:Dihydrolipoamide acetyltransferase component of pyruvate dehydrogenase complex n=1 Tax=Actinomadura nitritigenes TaxID=134602 RepID=A0ABS3QVM2_9ACTN|nr:dihydrolipoamide acetyltransferase family protein [Actinomadura nitritigenes]MBO2437822.1 2-oxo acid dehydrogenase subunit E2 [Actinomadura nitritigenes]
MPDFTMPALGADMDRGTLTEWLVKPGDRVHRGDIVAVVETEKSDIEVECFADGVVDALLVEPGVSVPVGTPLARLAPASDTTAEPAEPAEPGHAGPGRPVEAEAAPPAAVSPPQDGGPREEQARPAARADRTATPLVRRLAQEKGVELGSVHGTGHGGRVVRADLDRATRPTERLRASPLARRLAAELGVDLGQVVGTGAHGTVKADDVRAAASGGPARAGAGREARQERPKSEPETTDRAAAMRRAIGRLMARSKREIPHYYLGTTIDMSTAVAWLRERNRELPVSRRILPAAMLLKASALGAREVPELNGHWRDDAFVPADGVDLGVVTAMRGAGVATPTLRGADRLALADLMAALKELLARARTGRMRGSELGDATITVTDLGDQGVESVTGVIFPPQVALLGFGKIVERPWAVDGLLGVRPVVTATLAADHRASDGRTGARLLAAVDRLLQHPEEL